MYNIVLIGSTGSGKDFILNNLIEKYNLEKIIIDCTRPKREGEVDGETYNFLTNDEFEQNARNKKYLDQQTYNTIHGEWKYGLNVDSLLKNNSIAILDKEALIKYKKLFPDCISIFISTIDETERFYRSVMRMKNISINDVKEVYRRIKTDEDKFYDIEKFVDYIVPQTYNNITLDLIYDIVDKTGLEKRRV